MFPRLVIMLQQHSSLQSQMSNATISYSQSEVTTSGEPATILIRGHHHGEGHGEVEFVQSLARS